MGFEERTLDDRVVQASRMAASTNKTAGIGVSPSVRRGSTKSVRFRAEVSISISISISIPSIRTVGDRFLWGSNHDDPQVKALNSELGRDRSNPRGGRGGPRTIFDDHNTNLMMVGCWGMDSRPATK